VNVRYQGWLSGLVNPTWPKHCTLCGTHLRAGQRRGLAGVHSVVMWTMLYLLHAVAGAIAFAVVLFLLWPGHWDHPVAGRVGPLLGAGLGLYLAERSQRKGTLLDHPRSERLDSDERGDDVREAPGSQRAGEQGEGANERGVAPHALQARVSSPSPVRPDRGVVMAASGERSAKRAGQPSAAGGRLGAASQGSLGEGS
jgi:hypothetical protein